MNDLLDGHERRQLEQMRRWHDEASVLIPRLERERDEAVKFCQQVTVTLGEVFSGMSPWRPIETAPEETPILVVHPRGIAIAQLDYTEEWLALSGEHDWAFEEGGEITRVYPTHWMPLPESPGEAQDARVTA